MPERSKRAIGGLLGRDELSRGLEVERLPVRRSDLKSVVMPFLLGQVFHVTSTAALERIQTSGFIKSNRDGEFGFTFPQSQSSYGRQQGYVSLFDMRERSEEIVRETLMKFYFPKPSSADPAYLFLHELYYERLVPWTEAPTGAMVVPHVEAWYPGDVPLAALSHAIAVEVLADDADSAYRGIMYALRQDIDELLDSRVLIEAKTISQLKQRVEEWAAVAKEGGLDVNLNWDDSRIRMTPHGFGLAVQARRPEYWRRIME